MASEESYESSNSSTEDIDPSSRKTIPAHVGCCYIFSNDLVRFSVILYFFWNGICYIAGSILFTTGYNSTALKIQDQIVCAATSNVYVFSILWFCFGTIFILTCIGYSAIIDDENKKIYSSNESLFLYIIGIFCKTVPTVIRLLHIFNLFQLYIITLDFLILPECNSQQMRSILFMIHILWWFIVIFGIICKKKVLLPPLLYNPLNTSTDFISYMNNVLHSFGL